MSHRPRKPTTSPAPPSPQPETPSPPPKSARSAPLFSFISPGRARSARPALGPAEQCARTRSARHDAQIRPDAIRDLERELEVRMPRNQPPIPHDAVLPVAARRTDRVQVHQGDVLAVARHQRLEPLVALDPALADGA